MKKVYSLQFTVYSISLFLLLSTVCFAQQNDDLEFTLDVTTPTAPLPKVFRPNIDLSGRGFYREVGWPQTLAAKEVLSIWQKDIGFSGLYRMQYNLWEIHQLAKDPEAQKKLLNNYEGIIKNITDSGGVVILDIFGMPAGLGNVLDKKSPPRDLKAFKELVKRYIRDLSCVKKYNIWYEVWNAPDLDDFFLGRIQEYLNLYRQVAEGINELKEETKVHIPLGGPSVSWWFHNLDANTSVTPERSLIYELIKFCSHYRLPLDFITWHGFSGDPGVERETTVYKKTPVNLIRDWLTYFNLDRDIPLIVDEWNYDRDYNVLPERKEKSFISASYIPSRIKNMHEAGIDYQTYFCMEDFQNNKEGLVRNTGIFYFNPEYIEYKGGAKCIYNVFKMLAKLGNDMFPAKFEDGFAGIIATKAKGGFAILVYNYVDPEITRNYLSNNIATLNSAERKILLNIIKSEKLGKIMQHQLDIASLRATHKVKALLKKAQQLNDRAKKLEASPRNIKINIKNLKDVYLYQRYMVDSSCSLDCEFAPAAEKEVGALEPYQETLVLSPYSVQMIILTEKPKEAEITVPAVNVQPAPDKTDVNTDKKE